MTIRTKLTCQTEFWTRSPNLAFFFALRPSLLLLQAKTRLRTHVFNSGSKTKLATEKLTPPQDSAHSTYPPTQLSANSVIVEKHSRFFRGGDESRFGRNSHVRLSFGRGVQIWPPFCSTIFPSPARSEKPPQNPRFPLWSENETSYRKLTPPQDSAYSTYPPTQLSTKSVTKS